MPQNTHTHDEGIGKYLHSGTQILLRQLLFDESIQLGSFLTIAICSFD
jgi:hypothetical protein